jgi:adenosine deaminase/aminodeoxyfutalosine deaminase
MTTRRHHADEQEIEPWLRSLPKAELHLHLEGSVAAPTLRKLSLRHDESPLTLAQSRSAYQYTDFPSFLQSFKAVTQRMQTPADYQLVAWEMAQALAAQGVRHAEVYVSFGIIYYWKKEEVEPYLEAIERARLRAERELGLSILWLADAVRHFGVADAARVFRKAAELRAQFPAIAGIGIGGDEARGPASLFRELYAQARESGLRLTAHAGESVGPESIWSALTIGAERIGHALSAQHDPELLELLAERQIPLELCPTSNIRTGCCPSFDDHPLRRYFDAGLMVTLNSDDPPMFSSDLLGEYLLAHQQFAFTREQLRELAANSVEASFLAPDRKLQLLADIERYPA